HHPNSFRLSVLRLDLLQKRPQRRAVAGVARQDLITERKAVRGDDQRDHDLHAILALVAAVAEPAFVFRILRRIAFEIGSRQLVEQDVKFRPKQVLPALPEMTEKRLLVRKEFIQAAVERVFLNQRIILTEKVPHRALLKPQTMQSPLAARIYEAIAHERLQNMLP